MTAGSAAVDVLRHGWQDAATTFAPDVPQVAQLLQNRIEVAVANGGLDERHLLEAIAEVEVAASHAGSPAGDLLVRRLRRTVYEYLLALDAVPSPGGDPEHPPATTSSGPMVGAEEIAALRSAARPAPPAQPAPRLHIAPTPEAAAPDDGDDVPGAGWRPRVSPAQSHAETPAAAPLDMAVAPRSGFHIVEDTHPTTVPHDADASPLAMPAFAGDLGADTDDTASPVLHGDAMDVFEPASAPEQEPDAGEPPPAAAATDLLQAIAHPEPHLTVIDQAAVPTDPDTSTHPVSEAYPPEFQAWRAAISDAALAREELALSQSAAAAAATPPAPPQAPPPPPTPAVAPAAPVAPAVEPEPQPAPDAGWRVREQGDSAGGAHRDNASRRVVAAPVVDDNPFESNPALAETRERIEDRLRRKRCDEAAALLQEVAREAGGRVVAELAMNAGDRCRALGKTNAALSCYLAASRADPLFDAPLVQLADICIDDQDTELAVTYLERVAQLHRLRGDDKGALRVYRRIVTIAPYREDMLTTLMSAQSTGRFDS